MTVKEMFEKSLALGLELHIDNNDYDNFVVPHFNLLLAEMYHYNNAARRRSGKEELTAVPVIVNWEEVNPYEEVYDSAMIYGLYAKLMVADGDTELAPTYMQLYYAHRDAALKAQWERIEDGYEASDD